MLIEIAEQASIQGHILQGLVDIYLEDDLDGVQDAVQEGMAYDILKLMESPVSNPLKFVEMHMLYGWRSDRFWVLQERDAWIIGNVSYYGTKGQKYPYLDNNVTTYINKQVK